MGQLREYFDRIQGRLLLAFALVFLGTLAIWYVGYSSLDRFSTEVSARDEVLFERTDLDHACVVYQNINRSETVSDGFHHLFDLIFFAHVADDR